MRKKHTVDEECRKEKKLKPTKKVTVGRVNSSVKITNKKVNGAGLNYKKNSVNGKTAEFWERDNSSLMVRQGSQT